MDFKFVQLENYHNYQDMVDLWNNTIDNIHQVSLKLFMQNSILDENVLKKNSYVAIHNGKLVGYVILKTYKDSSVLNISKNEAFINVLLVDKSFHNKGIGTKLLEMVESVSREMSISLLHIGCSTLTYGPGVFGDESERAINWFEKRGYGHTYKAFDLHMVGCENNIIKLEDRHDVYARKGNIEDKEKLLSFLNKEFKGGWEYEAIEYFNHGGDGSEYVILFNSSNEVIGFCKMNDIDSITLGHSVSWHVYYNNLGGIGPLGVGKEYRKQNLGYFVTGTAINELINKGCKNIIVNWTGLVDFYRKFGFSVCDKYYGLQKRL